MLAGRLSVSGDSNRRVGVRARTWWRPTHGVRVWIVEATNPISLCGHQH